MPLPPRDEFEEHVLPHLDSVFRVARRLARDHAEADDLVQETMLRAYRAFPRFEMREYGVKPWLLKILHNASITYLNKARRQPASRDDAFFGQFASLPDDGSEPLTGIDKIDWDVVDEQLKKAVESLQPEYQSVLLLWAFEELSYKDIAEACDCAIGTVMSRLYRARQILGKKLEEYARSENLRKKA